MRQAIAETPARHFDQSTYLANLSSLLIGLYERSGDITVLHEVIKDLRDARPGSPFDWAGYLHTGM
jgi:hypothetical protein